MESRRDRYRLASGQISWWLLQLGCGWRAAETAPWAMFSKVPWTLQLGCGWRAAETALRRAATPAAAASIGLRMESRRDPAAGRIDPMLSRLNWAADGEPPRLRPWSRYSPPLHELQLGCGWRAAETAALPRWGRRPRKGFNWAADARRRDGLTKTTPRFGRLPGHCQHRRSLGVRAGS